MFHSVYGSPSNSVTMMEPPGGQRQQGAAEEVDEQLLVVAHLAVDVGALAADVGEVEDDAVHGAPRLPRLLVGQPGAHAARIDAVQHPPGGRLDLVHALARMGVFPPELRQALLQHRGRDPRAAVVLDQRRREAQISLTDQEDGVVGREGDRGRLVAGRLALRRTVRLLRLLLLVLLVLGRRRWRGPWHGPPLLRELPPLGHV